MQTLYYSDIQRLITQSPRMPLLTPTSESSDPFTCPVCLEINLAMVMHFSCGNIICAPDAISLIENEQNCPMCRGELVDEDRSLPTKLAKVPAPLQSFVDLIQYKCEICAEKFSYAEAIHHHKNCTVKTSTLRPNHPPHVPIRGQEPLVRCEIISNPPTTNTHERNVRPSRLLIYHHEGVQIRAKFVCENWTAARVKRQISDLTGDKVDNIKLFKFIHTEIPNDAVVKDFARANGANHISSFVTKDRLADCCAHLIFHEIGPTPYLPNRNVNLDEDEAW